MGRTGPGSPSGSATVSVDAEGMPPGWHGFHVHATGLCEPDSPDPADPTEVGDFLSAGGHLGADEAAHGDHAGDLPPLDVGQDGTASLEVTTDRFALEDLLDDDGSAVMVHSGPDNLGNVPSRYAPDGPDAETLAAGDSGTRIACGVIERRAG
jgi:Cu-Zn family superoxide dismutase